MNNNNQNGRVICRGITSNQGSYQLNIDLNGKLRLSFNNLDFYSEEVIKPVNLNSIAESTLIPRETVRRVVNSLKHKKRRKKNNNKIYVTEFVTDPKFLVTSSNKTLRNMLHDTLVIIVHMFNPV